MEEHCGLESSSASTWRATREEAQDGNQDTGTEKRDDDGPNQAVGTQTNEARQETAEKCADDANDGIADDTITTAPDHVRQQTGDQADDQSPEHRGQTKIDSSKNHCSKCQMNSTSCGKRVMCFTHMFARSVLDRAYAYKQ